ncbi:hypothetical protein D6789_04015 [Candidatus Woesearchaeota archaeon]|nr:MAG: hypothetical protein D6789_04015 [Candidatus Woesearchaeota archaeon]
MFQFDLFFFPETEEDEQFLEELDSEVVPIELTPQPRTENILGRLLLVLLLLAAGGATYYFLKRRSQLVVDNFFEAPNELDRVLTLIKKAGGRITQKDLRKQLPESEAKVSLMIAQLEAQGKIQKIKRGRGNILILK